MICKACGGKGEEIIIKETPSGRYLGYRKYVCKTCHGTGRVENMTKSCFNCANKEEIYDNGEENIVVCEINRYRENIYPREAEAVAGRCIAYKEDNKQTNEEYLKSCNTEQLAEFLCEVWCGIDEVINIMSEDGEINKKDAIVKWLKQPHADKE